LLLSPWTCMVNSTNREALAMRYLPIPCYLFPFRPKYLLQHPALTPSARFPLRIPLLMLAVQLFTAETSKVTVSEELNFLLTLEESYFCSITDLIRGWLLPNGGSGHGSHSASVQSVWDLWLIKCHCDRIFSEHFVFHCPIIPSLPFTHSFGCHWQYNSLEFTVSLNNKASWELRSSASLRSD
jgi:hypothetical protein